MDPVTAIALFTALVRGAKELQPYVAELMRKGEIPIEREAEVLAAFEELKKQDFKGPAWKVE